MNQNFFSPYRYFRSAAGLAVLLLQIHPAFAQRSRIGGSIDSTRRVRLAGQLHPLASAENDAGPMSATETLPSMKLILQPAAAQQADLEKLLAAQQDPASPEYHHWITPEQYADRFGASSQDIQKLSDWLVQHNLQVTGVSRSRNAITFAGAAGDVDATFGAQLRHYRVDGEAHFANAAEPTIPETIGSVVRSVKGLHDFKMRPKARPRYNSSSGSHYLSPADAGVIYNVASLRNAGLDGSGQSVVVAGQTQINLSDIQTFRSRFQLPGHDPQMILVPNTRDPGVSKGDLGEADLDVEWVTAMAPNANVIYTYSFDVMDAVAYAIDQNLAPVLSLSYGLCEPQTSNSDLGTLQSWARQANLQGITWVSASGDSGGADCVFGTTMNNGGLAVDAPASIPEVTGVGGTTLTEGSTQQYWGSNAANQGSVLSYIPESVWNDSARDGEPSAGGGGASTFYPKPSWQTGPGVPSDGARDVPDVSFAASADHDGYMVITGGALSIYGGTSAGAPSFAGIIALLNQHLVVSGQQQAPGVGNVNPKLYSLAQTNPEIFHDVTAGNNIISVTCGGRSRNCVPGAWGYNAGPGYDQASGLGSLDAYALVNTWHNASSALGKGTPSMALAGAAVVAPSGTATLTATVQAAGGATPTGSVTFNLGGTSLGSANLEASGILSTATIRVTGGQLATGANSITAQYSGDTGYNSASASAAMTVETPATGAPSIAAVGNGASYKQAFAPGMILSVFGLQLASSTASAGSLPLPLQLGGASATIDGVATPLYYASPSQINLQIPYETSTGGVSTLSVTAGGKTTTSTLYMGAMGPGIFVDGQGTLVPTGTTPRGSVIGMYITGEGAVGPLVTTGSAPASSTLVTALPKPVHNVQVTVGGVLANVQFVGIPWGLVGVTQINFEVPTGSGTGPQPVVVNVGGASSVAAILNVTN